MNVFEKIQNDINAVKEWNQEAGNELHDQFHYVQNSFWSNSDLTDYIKSENDVADKHYEVGSIQHDDIRAIQDAIIFYFG